MELDDLEEVTGKSLNLDEPDDTAGSALLGSEGNASPSLGDQESGTAAAAASEEPAASNAAPAAAAVVTSPRPLMELAGRFRLSNLSYLKPVSEIVSILSLAAPWQC